MDCQVNLVRAAQARLCMCLCAGVALFRPRQDMRGPSAGAATVSVNSTTADTHKAISACTTLSCGSCVLPCAATTVCTRISARPPLSPPSALNNISRHVRKGPTRLSNGPSINISNKRSRNIAAMTPGKALSVNRSAAAPPPRKSSAVVLQHKQKVTCWLIGQGAVMHAVLQLNSSAESDKLL
eukprot:GHRR01032273.1.p1 GENE.GHRR01032273.1~~GHRR01032273.1.p1  ORF type:complete len:183 (-),score=46.67 GHRR01032273.1:88-636(-)